MSHLFICNSWGSFFESSWNNTSFPSCFGVDMTLFVTWVVDHWETNNFLYESSSTLKLLTNDILSSTTYYRYHVPRDYPLAMRLDNWWMVRTPYSSYKIDVGYSRCRTFCVKALISWKFKLLSIVIPRYSICCVFWMIEHKQFLR